jgi:hypothetical protein
MLDQDGSQYEYQVAPERQRSQSSAGAAAQGLERQVRDTVETLKLKIENLRLYLSWRK